MDTTKTNKSNKAMGATDNNTDIDLKELLLASHSEITNLRKQVDEFSQNQHSPVAIVGIGCRFPGGCDSPDSYWQYLLDGKNAVKEMTDERWGADLLYNDDPDKPGKIYSKHVGLIDDVEKFDAETFNIPRAEAELMDPQQRILLMVCHEAIINAGLDPEALKGTKTGVFIGVSTNDYSRLTLNHDVHPDIGGYACLGSASSVAAGRISYLMDFNGPTLSIDTSCSSSLLAVHTACENIRRGECDVALAGGINLILTPENSIGLSRMQALSPTGKCKTFDADADGYVRGEGCGVVVLKSLKQAERDGDDIYAVIKGSAVNHDGTSNGLTAPNGNMQEDVISCAIQNAGIDAKDIHYVEAHGTGTNLGDPIEVNALARSLRSGDDKTPLIIGSAKTNLGHLEAAAGVAALIKMVLSMKGKKIPPHLHFKTPNPYISWDKYNIQVPVKTQEWLIEDNASYGAVSAFGLSGTNVHMVTEFYRATHADVGTRDAETLPASSLSDSDELNTEQDSVLTVSARSFDALGATVNRWRDYLKSSNEDLNLICLNSQLYRGGCLEDHDYRLAVQASDKSKMIEMLESYKDGDHSGQVFSSDINGKDETKNIAMLFSGQGSQYLGMGQSLYNYSDIYRSVIDECEVIYQGITGESITSLLFEKTNRDINNTCYTQPAIFCTQVALFEFWRDKGVTPSFVIGHSVGEYAAAYAAGVMSLKDALNLVVKRGRLMVELCEPGGMLVVMTDRETVDRVVQEYSDQSRVSIGAVNSENNIVVSGDQILIQDLKSKFDTMDIRSVFLRVSHGFHSPLMEPMQKEFEKEVEKALLLEPSIPFYSTVTGNEVHSELCSSSYWVDQVSATVEFCKGINDLGKNEVSAFIEIGSGTTLTGLANLNVGIDASKSYYSIRNNKTDVSDLRRSLARLFASGLISSKDIDSPDPEKVRRLSIPAPAPSLDTFWCEFNPNYSQSARGVSGNILGEKTSLANGDCVFESRISKKSPLQVSDHQLYGIAILPGAIHISSLIEIAQSLGFSRGYEIKDVEFLSPIVFEGADLRDVQYVCQTLADSRTVSAYSRASDSDSDNEWDEHFSSVLSDNVSIEKAENFNVEALKESLSEHITEDGFYRELNAAEFICKNEFRWVSSVWRKPGTCLIKLRTPSNDSGESYPLHPGLIGAIFHSITAASYDDSFVLSAKNRFFTPTAMSSMRVFNAVKGELWCHIEAFDDLDNDNDQTCSHKISVYSESGELVLTIDLLRSKKTSKSSLLKPPSSSLIYGINWEKAEHVTTPQEVAAGPDQNKGLHILVGRKSDKDVIEGLSHIGESVEFLDVSFFDEDNESTVTKKRILDELATILDRNKYVTLASVIFLSKNGDSQNIGYQETSKKELKYDAIFHPALSIYQFLTGRSISPNWVFVGLNEGDDVFAPINASLDGYVRVLRNEVDISRVKKISIFDRASNAAQCIIGELFSENHDDDVRYVAGERLVPRFSSTKISNRGLARRDNSEKKIFEACKSYVIAGGVGAIGFGLADFMVRNGAKNIILLSRRDVSDVSGATSSTSDDVNILSMQCDIANAENVETTFKKIEQEIAPIDGVFNCAGLLNDGLIESQSWEEFKLPLQAKIQGSWSLHQASYGRKVNWFVLFSSVASIFGSAGQSNYAAANAFLDGLAEFRQRNGLAALSLNWGPWSGDGMASSKDVVSNLGRVKGLSLLDTEQAFDIMVQLSRYAGRNSHNPANYSVVDIHWDEFSSVLSNGQKKSLFSPVVSVENANAQTKSRTGIDIDDFKRKVDTLEESDRGDFIQTSMTKVICTLLALPEKHFLDPDEPLQSLGMDSLMAVELRSTISKLLGKSLPATLLFDFPTLNAMTNYIVSEIFPQGDECDDQASLDDDSLDEDIDVESLSDSDLASLLAEELEC